MAGKIDWLETFSSSKVGKAKLNFFNILSNLNNYMSDDIDYVITDKEWNDDFKKVTYPISSLC